MHGLGVDQSSGKTGPEFFQRAGFCDVLQQFIPIPDGAKEERVVVDVTVDSLLGGSSLALCSTITEFQVAGAVFLK